MKDRIKELDNSIDEKLTHVFRTIFTEKNKPMILNFRNNLAEILGIKLEEIKLSKSKKVRQTAGKKKKNKNKNKTQKSQDNISTGVSNVSTEPINQMMVSNNTRSDEASQDNIASGVDKLFHMIIKFHFMVFRLTPKGIKKLLELAYNILKLMKNIYSIKVIGKPLILIVLYLLYSNPYTRIMLYIFMDITIALWNMGPNVGIEAYIKREVDKLKNILYAAAMYLVEYYGSKFTSYMISQFGAPTAEYIAKVLFKDYLGGAINDITEELVKLRLENSELANALNEIRTDAFNNVRRLARIESGVFTTQSAVERLENTIHTFDIDNKFNQELIKNEITSVGRLVMYSGNDAQLARLEGLLLTNLRTTDAGRFLNNFLPSNSLAINGVPTSNVFTAAAALGSMAYKSRYRPGSRLTNGPHSSF
jgi:hypothetical protein